MADTTATLSNYRQAPRKVSLVAGLIRNQPAAHALVLLEHLPKRASEPMAKLVRSAISNARQQGLNADDLVISRIEVGKGIVFKRMMPRARGRGAPIHKKTSNVRLTLTERPRKAKKAAVKKVKAAKPALADA